MNFRRTIFLASLVCGTAAAACTQDDEPANPAPTDAAAAKDSPAEGHADATDANQTDANQGDLVARGSYLVQHVAACPDCHTPRLADGTLDVTKHLAGSQTPFADVVPDEAGPDGGLGKIYAKNLTPDMDTGLGKWTDDQIKKAFLDGVDDKGNPLFPIMPYFVFHNMTDDDANAIVAYLRSIPAVKNEIPENEPVPGFTAAAMPIPVDMIPKSTIQVGQPNYDQAQKGRYLAGQIGVCMECHTKHVMMSPIPLDTTKLFAGNEVFSLPPPFGDVHSANITPDMNGIKDWTPEDVKNLLKMGTDKMGNRICPPMPAGSMQAFGDLTEDDALAIGYYLTTIPPVANGMIPKCTLPTPEGGTPDATDAAKQDGPSSSDGSSTDAATTEAAPSEASTDAHAD
jgi:hypothetical protein